MADKKITELTELATVAQEDLFVVVDNPTGTPITKKITCASLFSTVNFTTSTAVKEAITVKATILAAVPTVNANAVIAAGKFSTSANALATNTAHQYGIIARSELIGAAANVTTEHAAGKFTLDISNAASLLVNTYGLIVEIANTGTRTVNTQSFIAFAERNRSLTASTLYLFDVGQNGLANVTANVLGGSTNTLNMFINSAATGATHKMKVRVNGGDYWLVLSANAT